MSEGSLPETMVAESVIEVDMPPAPSGGFAARVRLRGEHDLSTAHEVHAALGSISGSVLVDLADCSFIDSTIIGVLITSSQELEREGHVLELYVPPENAAVFRTLEVTGMGELVVLHSTPPAARSRG